MTIKGRYTQLTRVASLEFFIGRDWGYARDGKGNTIGAVTRNFTPLPGSSYIIEETDVVPPIKNIPIPTGG